MARAKGKILDRLGGHAWDSGGRVFDITSQENGIFRVGECCDGWFYIELTADELRALAVEIFHAAYTESAHEHTT